MNLKRWIAIMVVAIVVVATTGAIVAYAMNAKNERNTEDGGSDDATTTSYTLDPNDPLYDAKISLMVNISDEDLEKYVLSYSKRFLDSSMPSRAAERTSAASKVGWGAWEGMRMYDAVSFPFSPVAAGKTEYSQEETATMVEELRMEIAENPPVGMMVLEGLEKIEMTDGTIVADLNADWVREALDLYNQYGVGVWLTYHTKYWETYGIELPHDGQDVAEWRAAHPNAPEVTKELMELADDLYISEEEPANYDRIGKQILMLFDRLTCEGVGTYSTSTFWYLNSATQANQVRALLNTDPSRIESLPSLNFSLRVKYDNGEERQIFFGFNIYDKRLLIFDQKATPTVIVQPTVEVTTSSGGSGGSGGNGGGGGGGNRYYKDDGQGSVHQGNAPVGGGEGRGETGAATADMSQYDMADAGGGVDTNQGHSDPNTVRPITPAASQEVSGNTNQNQMNYGDNNGASNNSGVSTGGSGGSGGQSSNTNNGSSAGEFDEPGI